MFYHFSISVWLWYIHVLVLTYFFICKWRLKFKLPMRVIIVHVEVIVQMCEIYKLNCLVMLELDIYVLFNLIFYHLIRCSSELFSIFFIFVCTPRCICFTTFSFLLCVPCRPMLYLFKVNIIDIISWFNIWNFK